MMETYKCGTCGDLLTEGVMCVACNHKLHFQCAGITEAGYRKLGDRKLTWRCIKCKQAGIPPSSPISLKPASPRLTDNDESSILQEIRILSNKLAPLENLRVEILDLKTELSEFKNSLTMKFTEVINEFNTKLDNFEQRIVQVEKVQVQVNALQVRLEKWEEEQNSKDQWCRINNVEIKGLSQTPTENLFEVMSKLGNKINYPINKNQINFVTRVPTREKDRARPIIVSFCNRYVKEEFVAAARYEQKNGPLTNNLIGTPGSQRIFINDHLTLQNKLLLSKAKKTAVEADFRYIWVKHAKIHIRKTDTSPIIVIKSEKDLAKII